jgi:hypothetical protein
MGSILLITGLILYTLNYSIGWALASEKLSIQVRTHQIIYSLLIINVFFAMFFVDLFSTGFVFGVISLLMLLILPFGKKGGTYHKVISTVGFLSYLLFIFY